MLMLFRECGTQTKRKRAGGEQDEPQNVFPNFKLSKQRHGKIKARQFKGSSLNVESLQSEAGHFTAKIKIWRRERQPVTHGSQLVVLSAQYINPDKEGSLIVVFCPGLLWVALGKGVGVGGVGCSSVVLHPAVLLYKGIDHFLHGQVGDQLVLGQRTPGDWVKMAYPLR